MTDTMSVDCGTKSVVNALLVFGELCLLHLCVAANKDRLKNNCLNMKSWTMLYATGFNSNGAELSSPPDLVSVEARLIGYKEDA